MKRQPRINHKHELIIKSKVVEKSSNKLSILKFRMKNRDYYNHDNTSVSNNTQDLNKLNFKKT